MIEFAAIIGRGLGSFRLELMLYSARKLARFMRLMTDG